ncbi:hypothetical protein B0A48_00336 [Cryoendolithus antarcticus]|uniref:Uncharacterized protein n=1 Tax=Cryoendolithus antarcticus TaxID=1507870 RepID=A0A1V8TUG4_9PEZI|nr:hypothetical protein B0A48_00336 [Cryoendolithus antarcticus]
MDPLSISVAILSLIGATGKVATTINDIAGKSSRAPSTVTAISAECGIITRTLRHVEHIARTEPSALTFRLAGDGAATSGDPSQDEGEEESPSLDATMYSALESCDLTIVALSATLQKCKGSSSLSRKTKFLLNETELQDRLQSLRGLNQAMTGLLAAVQAESLSAVRLILNDNSAALDTMVRQSNVLRRNHEPSIITGITDASPFDFDDGVVDSLAYRRAFRKFRTGNKADLPRPIAEPPNKDDSVTIVDSAHSAIANGANGGPGQLAPTARHSISPPTAIIAASDVPDPGPAEGSSKHLLEAAGKGSLTLVSASLRQGADIEFCGDDGCTALLLATQGGHSKIVRVLSEYSADCEAIDASGKNSLHMAASSGDLISCEIVLERVKDIDASDKDGWTALHYAAKHNHEEIVDLLCTKGADLTAAVSAGSLDAGAHPLHVAVRSRSNRATRSLLKAGSSARAKCSDRNLPLNIAAMNGDSAMIECLLDAGADIEATGKEDNPPIHHAAANNRSLAISTLLQGGAQLQPRLHISGNTPLHTAALFSNTAAAQFLIQKGHTVNTLDYAGDTPLHVAAKAGSAATVSLLLDSGGDVDAIGADASTPLVLAATGGHFAAAEVLMERGARISLRDKHHNQAITLAAKAGNVLLIDRLLKEGADKDARGQSGWPVISFAAGNGRVPVIKLLLQKGASITARTNTNDEPLHMGASWGHLNSVVALIEAGANIEEPGFEQTRPLHYSVRNADEPIVAYLLKKGAAADPLDDWGGSPFNYAAKYGRSKALKLLAQAGALVDRPARNGNRAVHLAALYSQPAALETLVSLQADINATGSDGYSPLCSACSIDDDKGCIDLLIRNGADLEIRSVADSYTALHIAVKQGRLDAIRKLLAAGAEIDATSKGGLTPQQLAVAGSKGEIIEVLREHEARAG